MIRVILAVLVLVLSACQTAPAAERLQATVPSTQAAVALATAVPTTSVPPSATPTQTPSLTPTQTPTATATATLTLTPTTTFTPSPTLTPSLTPTIEPAAFFSFRRPFTREQIDYFDRTYPFGVGSRNGLPVHHGVDFANPRGTPVLAIGTGTVYYAGLDVDTLFGPIPDYYGRLVVILHDFKSLDGLPVYSLYGHLQRAEVNTGDRVESGQRIGSVGDSGVAFGPHLHLEIRVGDPMSFSAVRNPDMWLLPHGDYGTLLGRITLADGTPIHEAVINVRRAGATSGTVREAYSYADDATIIPDPVWNENFSLGDLRSGDYEVFVSDRSGRYRFRQNVTIAPGQIGFVEIILDAPVD